MIEKITQVPRKWYHVGGGLSIFLGLLYLENNITKPYPVLKWVYTLHCTLCTMLVINFSENPF